MIIRVQWKWISIPKIRMRYMQLCGIKQEVHGILKKPEKQAAFIKVLMEVIHGNQLAGLALVFQPLINWEGSVYAFIPKTRRSYMQFLTTRITSLILRKEIRVFT